MTSSTDEKNSRGLSPAIMVTSFLLARKKEHGQTGEYYVTWHPAGCRSSNLSSFYPLLLCYLSRADLMLVLLRSTATQKVASSSLNHDRALRYFQEVNQIARNFLGGFVVLMPGRERGKARVTTLSS